MTDKLKQRFCKDYKLPIQLFEDELFEERLKLMGKYNEYLNFKKMIEEQYKDDEQAYLSDYNKTKDLVINFIKESEAFKRLNEIEIFTVDKTFPHCDAYKVPNIGKRYISIDMIKANFSSLVHFERNYIDKEVTTGLFGTYDWYEFISRFTDIEHIKNSKYIRQVVFGNCNPKRQVAYEKYLMTELVVGMIEKEIINEKEVYSLVADEIIIDINGMSDERIENILKYVESRDKNDIPLRVEVFTVGKIVNTDGFIKKLDDGSLTVKCVGPTDAPEIYRMLNGEEQNDNDLYFMDNGRKARYIEHKEISISWEPEA